MSSEARERAARVRLAVFDVDGVLTDGRLLLGDDGSEHKAFHVRDGHGFKMLLAAGVEVAILSARRSQAVERRMRGLGVARVVQGREDKLAALEEMLSDVGVDAGAVAFTGDDVLDLPVMVRAGLAVAVADAHPWVLAAAHWRTTAPGGHGAAREVCELILDAQGRLDGIRRDLVGG